MNLKQILLTLLGLMAFVLAMVGVVLPGLPTTPFLLLASFLFLKGNPRLYRWLVSHPKLGKGIRRFNEDHVIPLPVKVVALSMMTAMILISVLFLLTHFWVRVGVLLLGGVGTVVVLSFPSRPTP